MSKLFQLNLLCTPSSEYAKEENAMKFMPNIAFMWEVATHCKIQKELMNTKQEMTTNV